MPGIKGHNMTPIESGTEEKGEEYGTSAPPAEEGKDNDVSEPVQTTDSDGREEAGHIEESREETGKEDSVQEEPVRSKSDAEISKISEELKSVRDELRKSVEEKKEKAVQPLSEEQWANLEEQSGMDRRQLQFINNQQLQRDQRLLNQFESKLAKLEKESVLQEISRDPNWGDALKYRNEIEEFLGDYAPQHHSNRQVLEKAVIYGRGKNVNKTVQKVQNNKERNRRVVGASRGGGTASPKNGSMPVSLSASQRSAARAVGMSDEEYARIKAQTNVIER